jgi:predicted DCC family thiol-disulfide oxidoreductase YuxK
MYQKIIFFDGLCNLCNGSISLLILLDKRKVFRYAPLTGKTAKNLGIKQSLNEASQSVVYYRGKDQVFEKSDAAIYIVSDLFYLGEVLLILRLIPRFIRDSIYSLIAKYRYRLFGKRDVCRLPSIDEKTLFLD